jgi:hypothetical protein
VRRALSPAPPRHVTPDAVRGSVLVSADIERHVGWLQQIAELGVETIFLHHVGKEQRRFIETFAERVLPEVAR